MAEIGDIISELRKDKGLKQQDLADLLCVASNTISGYENGVFAPDLQNIAKLAEFFDVSTDYLLGLSHSSVNTRYVDKEYYRCSNRSISAGELIKKILKLNPENRKLLVEFMDFLENKDKKQTNKK
jgi:transcriptional regulator with XRE-family HTH domain